MSHIYRFAPHIWSSPILHWHMKVISIFSGPTKENHAKNLSKLGHWKYGLRYQDLLVSTEALEKALTRLPLKELEERNRRIKRACVLKSTKSVLPKEEQTKPEEDYGYLTPYLYEVIEEEHDRRTWRQ